MKQCNSFQGCDSALANETNETSTKLSRKKYIYIYFMSVLHLYYYFIKSIALKEKFHTTDVIVGDEKLRK